MLADLHGPGIFCLLGDFSRHGFVLLVLQVSWQYGMAEMERAQALVHGLKSARKEGEMLVLRALLSQANTAADCEGGSDAASSQTAPQREGFLSVQICGLIGTVCRFIS